MRSGCVDCLELLLPIANRPALTRALESAARYGDSAGMRLLLDRGAEPTADALRAAAASEGAPGDGIIALLDRGVRDEQALELALASRRHAGRSRTAKGRLQGRLSICARR